MREIDLSSWPRRTQFDFFRTYEFPQFNLTANVDITAFKPALKAHGVSFTVGTMYLIARIANRIPEFRTRIKGERAVEFEVVHPAATILVDENRFTFFTAHYQEDLSAFAENAAEKIEFAKKHPTLIDEGDPDELLFLTSLPWVSFTSMMHPLRLNPADSVPRFAWGKFFPQGDRLMMPLGVQVHHALMDGYHVGKFFETFQEQLDQPEEFLQAS